MNQIKIEKNIPIPTPGAAYRSKYRFRDMQVGDSIFIAKRRAAEVAGSVNYWRKATGFKFTARTVGGGCRVWRIE